MERKGCPSFAFELISLEETTRETINVSTVAVINYFS